jgi:hypothetical protein
MLNSDFHDAVSTQLQAAVKTNRNGVLVRQYLGYSLQVGAPDGASEHLSLVLCMTTPNAIDLYLFGEGCLRSRNYDIAETAFKAALSLDPHITVAKGGLLKVMIAREEYDDALGTCIVEIESSKDPKLQEYYEFLYASANDAKQKRFASRARHPHSAPPQHSR